mgnify:FL=1
MVSSDDERGNEKIGNCMKLKKYLSLPYRAIKKFSIARFLSIFVYLKNEGLEGTKKRFLESIYGTDLYRKELVIKNVKKIEKIEDCKKLVFPEIDSPEVSVIIPVYNEFSFTYHCLKSILDAGDKTPYEIIIADDCSNDLTTEILSVVKNIKVINTEENVKFLRNCNNAAKYAKGKYIFFLNNDTQVQSDWLDSQVRLMEQNPDIGMTGSKLIYADGRLQEAGGIIWKDGVAWNYGNRQDPYAPEYNYVKEVDYISGAAIMVRSEIWKKIGGFDERYVPAYCEDSDLAFEVRKEGFRVVYQPLSVVIHFEGISNGTNVQEGIKKYQVENTNKLYLKWKDQLESKDVCQKAVFQYRERSQNKKIILFIDHYVPTVDCDAGSKTVYEFLKMFTKKGYVVKFVGDNFYQKEPYTTMLQQLGVEVLCGNYYKEHIFDWIKQNKEMIDFAFLNRPHIAIKYIDFLRDNTNIKIIYYGHDLHFLRFRREYELTGDSSKLKESEKWYETEMYLMHNAAISYYPSVVEENEIKRIDDTIKVKAITAYAYDEFREDISYDFKDKEGILFVGGFVHKPNQDAVMWFVENIYPQIRIKKEIPFTIVGSYPTNTIRSLDGKNGIRVEGFVSDERLSELYQKNRIVVVPLRYGAGVKGKVVEAIYNGVPIVTTSVGAEGISDLEQIASICDSEEEFSNEVIRLYEDLDELKIRAMKSQKFVKKYYSMDTVWHIMQTDFE